MSQCYYNIDVTIFPIKSTELARGLKNTCCDFQTEIDSDITFHSDQFPMLWIENRLVH